PSGSSGEPSDDSEPSGSSNEPSDDSEPSGSSGEPSDDSEPSGSMEERFMQTEDPGESLNDLFNNLQTKVQNPERVDELLEIVTASEEAVQDVEKEEDKVDEVDVAEPQEDIREDIHEEMSEDTLEDIIEENSDEISEGLELHTDAPQFESLESQEEERLMDLLKSLQDESPTERPMQVQVEVPLEVPVEVPIAKEIPVKIPVEVPIPKEIPVQKDVLAVREVSVEKIIPIEKEVLVMNHESRDTATAEISEENATPSQKSSVGDKIDGTNGTQETESNRDAKASEQNQKEHEKEVVEINPTGEKTEDKLELVTYEKRRKGLFSRMLDRIKNAFKKKPKQIPEAKEIAQEHKQEIKMMESESVTSHLEHKELQITGVINGSIQGENIIINTGALVKKSVEAKGVVLCMKDSTVMGDLKGEEIIVEGMVRGNVYASQKVQITDNALIIGNIYAPEIAVDKEAIIQGSIFDFEKKEMIDEGDERKCENVSVSM
ncbi:MAG: polymer-forming cytoskeletal protein, partial [Lachnospiraceae bacterium]